MTIEVMRGMTSTLTVGERIAWYRRRRGISQEVLAGQVGRTADWLSKIENGRIELDRLSVLRMIAGVLDVSLADLIAEPSLMEWTEDSGQQTVPALRAVLMDYRQVTGLTEAPRPGVPMDLSEMRSSLDAAWSAYQQSRFGFVTQRLVDLIPQYSHAQQAYSDDSHRIAAGRLALAYQLAASTLTKLGEADLAWSASNRGIEAARTSENPLILGSLLRSVAHSLLSTGAYGEAVELTNEVARFFAPHLPEASRMMLSVYGTALLAGSMAAARNDDRDSTQQFLDEAERAARRVGTDQNLMWTAFGPTNVTIHRVSTAMELGDVQIALDLGPRLDTSTMPTERRVRHELEVSRALSSANRRDDALSRVLDAEQGAPEQVRYHFLSRHLVQTWIRTQRTRPSIELSGLAKRLHVA